MSAGRPPPPEARGLDLHYVNQRLAALYDIECGWSADRDFYLSLAGPPPQRILDLGCGTGLLCDAYAARGHLVTGVDPSPTMLAIARQKPNGHRIAWVEATAEAYRAETPFDLVIMTGHAFQVLLTDAAIRACLAGMRENVRPGGRIVFEIRNPAADWPAIWTGAATIDTPAGPVHKTTRVLASGGGRIVFEQRYGFADETLASTSELRFTPRRDIEAFLDAAGLAVEDVLGDWDGQPFDPAASLEMILRVSRK